MIDLTRYAIRRKSDGFYMPQPEGRAGRGGSLVEPVDPRDIAYTVRLFHSRVAAERSLAAWLKGKWITSRGEYSYGPDFTQESYEETEIVPQPDRKKEDMEVVPVHLELK